MSTTVTASEARDAVRWLYDNRWRPSQRALAESLAGALLRPVSQPTVCAWLAGTTDVPPSCRPLLMAFHEYRSRRAHAWKLWVEFSDCRDGRRWEKKRAWSDAFNAELAAMRKYGSIEAAPRPTGRRGRVHSAAADGDLHR